MGHLCKFYSMTPQQVREYTDFGELMQVWHAAHFDPKGIVLDDSEL